MNPATLRNNIKKYFETGKQPTQEEFQELIEAFVHRNHESEDNVGLGTTSPQNSLDVNGAVVIGADNAGLKRAPNNGLLVEGQVGVGTPAPLAELHVMGDVAFEQGALRVADKVIIDKNGIRIGEQTVIDINGNWTGVPIVAEDDGNGDDNDTPVDDEPVVEASPVGFTAMGWKGITKEGVFEFEKVHSNEGQNFEEADSKFVAKEDGLYFFSASIMVKKNLRDLSLRLGTDDKAVEYLPLLWDEDCGQSGAVTLVHRLEKDQKMWIQASGAINEGDIMGMTFSGHKI